MSLTQTRLREMLRYDAATGEFIWLRHSRRTDLVGKLAGCATRRGYILISVDGEQQYAHRLAWLYEKGEWPVGEIDHINGNKADTRISNLRDVARAINCQNKTKAQRNNRHGLLGVTSARGRFIAQIGMGGQHRYIGSFDTAEEAHAAYVAEKRAAHVGCTL